MFLLDLFRANPVSFSKLVLKQAAVSAAKMGLFARTFARDPLYATVAAGVEIGRYEDMTAIDQAGALLALGLNQFFYSACYTDDVSRNAAVDIAWLTTATLFFSAYKGLELVEHACTRQLRM